MRRLSYIRIPLIFLLVVAAAGCIAQKEIAVQEPVKELTEKEKADVIEIALNDSRVKEKLKEGDYEIVGLYWISITREGPNTTSIALFDLEDLDKVREHVNKTRKRAQATQMLIGVIIYAGDPHAPRTELTIAVNLKERMATDILMRPLKPVLAAPAIPSETPKPTISEALPHCCLVLSLEIAGKESKINEGDTLFEARANETLELKLKVKNIANNSVATYIQGLPETNYVGAWDFIITKEGREIWRLDTWAERHHWAFQPVLSKVTIESGQELEFKVKWRQVDNEDNPVPPGFYTVQGIVKLGDPPETQILKTRKELIIVP